MKKLMSGLLIFGQSKNGAFGILGAVGLMCTLSSTFAHAADIESSAAWRTTLRRSYVFFGTSDKQIELPDLVAGKKPEASAGTLTATTELARVEAEVAVPTSENSSVFFRFMGGKWRLKLHEAQAVQNGIDVNIELGGKLRQKVTSWLELETRIGARARRWAFEGGEIPRHGNMGLLIGVTPAVGPVSLTIENTLAAAWLYDLNSLGAQKDSSVLRIRPEYSYPTNFGSFNFGAEYYHTHTEFFGTKTIPRQTAFMLDDFELAAIVGGTFRF